MATDLPAAGPPRRDGKPRIPRERFRELVAEAMATIPQSLRSRIVNLELVVEDQPDAETLADLGLDPEQDVLFGLYHGTPISERGTAYSALPDRIAIYYLPLTDEHADEYHLRREIRRTVVHEVAHYFGLSDREIRRMGY
jgi:predicted Zn-dependent protease with MMP-like domain